LSGKPLVAWTIEQAKSSKYLDKIIVSTDDKTIAVISEEYGAAVPFVRPKELATDTATGIDVVLHTIEWVRNSNWPYELMMLLQPTSPLRTTEDIDKSIELLFSKKAQAVVSVCQAEHHPCKASTLSESGCMRNFVRPDVKNNNRQMLPTYYRENGAIYLFYCDYLKEKKSFFGDETFAYIMPQERSIDIDSPVDLKVAQILLDS